VFFTVFSRTRLELSLSEGNTICTGNVQISYDAQGGGLLKPSEYRHMGGGGLVKSSYNFYSG